MGVKHKFSKILIIKKWSVEVQENLQKMLKFPFKVPLKRNPFLKKVTQ